jgi:exonuclease III
MRGNTSKIIEFNQHLQQNKTDIFGVVESFLSSDDKPPRLDKSYRWVGKCRKNGLKKGGVGFFLKSDIMILDDNLNNSQNNEYERLWVLVRLNNIKVALGVAYFPNDGTNKPKTDELFFELLENTSSFASSGYEMILMGDFNGRCVTKCPFSDKKNSSCISII